MSTVVGLSLGIVTAYLLGLGTASAIGIIILGRDQVSSREQSHPPLISHVATGDGDMAGNDPFTTANEA